MGWLWKVNDSLAWRPSIDLGPHAIQGGNSWMLRAMRVSAVFAETALSRCLFPCYSSPNLRQFMSPWPAVACWIGCPSSGRETSPGVGDASYLPKMCRTTRC